MRWLAPLALVCLPLMAVAQEETAQEREDRGTIVAFIEDNLSGAGREVILRGFEGALSSRATATQLTIADSEGVWLTLNDITLDWNRSALLRGEVSVTDLTAAEILIDRPPVADTAVPSPEATGFALPELPVSIDIQRIAATRVVLGEALLGESIEGTIEASLSLSGGDGSARLQVQRTDDGPAGAVALEAAYSTADTALTINLTVTEAEDGLAATLLNLPGRPSVELVVAGSGPLNDFAAAIDLRTNGQDRLTGDVTLQGTQGAADGAEATRFTANFDGDLAPLFLPQYADFFGPRITLAATGLRQATGALDLEDLSLQARSVQLRGNAAFAADGLPQALSLTGQLADPEGRPVLLPGLDGTVSLEAATLDIGYDAREGETWRAKISGRSFTSLPATVDSFDLTGSGRISRAPQGNRIGGTLAVETAGLVMADPALAEAVGSLVTATTRFWWQEGTDEFRIGTLALSAGGVEAEASGSVWGLSEGFRLVGSAAVTAPDMARFSRLAGRPLSGAGKVEVSGQGSPLGGDFGIEARVQGTDLAIGQAEVDNLLRGVATVSADVVRDATGTEIRSFDVTSAAIAASGTGSIASDEADLNFGFQMPDLSIIGPQYGGVASGRATLTGPLVAGEARITAQVDALDLRVGQPEADRLLRGATALRLDANLQGAALRIEQLTLANPSLSARVSGTLAPAGSDIVIRAELPDFGAVRAGYGGAIAADLAVRGTAEAARVTLTANTSGLQVGQPEADRLLAGETTLRLAADLASSVWQIEAFEITNAALNATAAGTVAAAGSDITARIALANLGLVRPGFGGSIAADLVLKGTLDSGEASLEATAQSLRLGQPQADRVLAGNSRLSARARLVDGAVRLDDLQLEAPQITASATGRLTSAQRTLDLNARLTNLALLLPDFPGPVTLQGTASEGEGGYTLDLSGTGPGQIDARIVGSVGPNLRVADLAITGTAQAGLANPFLGSRVVSGPVSVDLRLSGPFALSSLAGRVSLSQGRLADPGLPFTVQGITTTATLSAGQARLDASAQISTGGAVSATGSIGLAQPFNAELDVVLSSVVLRDPQLFETRANGNIRVSGPLTGGALISGRIALPEAEIRIASTGLGGAASFDDLKHINEPAPVRETRRRAGLLQDGSSTASSSVRPFALDLVISAPNRLFLRGRGLDAELGGELRVAGTTANVIPSGAFNLIRGRLDLLGRRLVLNRASVQLAGSFDPTLDIQATTEANGISSFVVIRGSAADPQVAFLSQPELPQEEVLAQLLFGRQLDQLSAFQALQLANAVATLAGRGGDGIVGNLRKSFGLDDLDVRTSEDGEAQLTAGKYLTENIYSEVVIDQSGKSEINLNLDLTDSLTVKGRVGADGDTGIGLYFEKDY